MKKLTSILISGLCIVLVLYGMASSLDFSSWVPIDIIVGILLLINSLIINSIIGDNKLNINFIMFFCIVIGFIFHFHYKLWQIIDIGIIVSSIVSITSVIKLKFEKEKRI